MAHPKLTNKPSPKMKTCGRCFESKPLTEFGRNAYYDRFGARDGLARNCRDCNRQISTARNRAQGIAPRRKPAVIAKKKAKKVKIRDGSIDAGLLLLLTAMPKELELTMEDIAFVCGCSVALIKYYQTKALRKLQRHASQLEVLRAISTTGSEHSFGVSSVYFAA